MADERKKPQSGRHRTGSSIGAAVRRASLKRRVRPSARARARKEAINKRPMPKPPARRPVKRTSAKASVSPELAAQISRVQDKFERLEAQAQLEDIFSAVGDIDKKLNKLTFDLEALGVRG